MNSSSSSSSFSSSSRVSSILCIRFREPCCRVSWRRSQISSRRVSKERRWLERTGTKSSAGPFCPFCSAINWFYPSITSAASADEETPLLSEAAKTRIKVTTAKTAIKINTSFRTAPPVIISLALLVQYFKGVYCPLVFINRKMKMRPRTFSGIPHLPDNRPLINIGPVFNKDSI